MRPLLLAAVALLGLIAASQAAPLGHGLRFAGAGGAPAGALPAPPAGSQLPASTEAGR